MSIASAIIIGIFVLLVLIGLGFLIWFLVRRFEPSGPSGPTGTPPPPPPTVPYISNVIAQTNQNCPSGYIQPGVFGSSNGNLKQGTGQNTPNIFLCMSQTNDPSSAITDLRAFQFGGTSELECPEGNKLEYQDDGTQWDFEKDCGATSPFTKLCQVGPGGLYGPIKNIAVTAASGTPSCPDGYILYNVDDHYIGSGTSGDLNRGCGGQTIMLCVQR